jgi:F-type H+-transporting ATPase subunit b
VHAQLQQFATAAAHAPKESILDGLGINFTLLILQAIAFLLMVFILAKWVYPVFLRIIDERQEKIDESTKAAEKAQKAAEKAEANVSNELAKARKEAADIVATAKTEATQMVEKADKNAKARAERIVAEAHEEIDKSVIAAKKTLERETLQLVKKAAGLAVAGVADSKLDEKLIKKSIEEAK